MPRPEAKAPGEGPAAGGNRHAGTSVTLISGRGGAHDRVRDAAWQILRDEHASTPGDSLVHASHEPRLDAPAIKNALTPHSIQPKQMEASAEAGTQWAACAARGVHGRLTMRPRERESGCQALLRTNSTKCGGKRGLRRALCDRRVASSVRRHVWRSREEAPGLSPDHRRRANGWFPTSGRECVVGSSSLPLESRSSRTACAGRWRAPTPRRVI
jgi:hypothetical protein